MEEKHPEVGHRKEDHSEEDHLLLVEIHMEPNHTPIHPPKHHGTPTTDMLPSPELWIQHTHGSQ